MSKRWLVIFFAITLAGFGFIAGFFSSSYSSHHSKTLAGDDGDKPLYWVAPMDSNFRSDKPGKSPMGMDLIPVYETAAQVQPGAITISPEVENNLGVRTALVEMSEIENVIRTVGIVQYDEDQLIHIHPRVSGWIDRLNVKSTGDPVKKGQELYALYSPELVNVQEEFLLALRGNSARLIEAAKGRMQALHISEKFISELEATRKIRQTVTFYSPQDGVVDKLNIREGFYVEPDKTLLSIGALNTVWVETEVFERQSHLVSVGDLVTMALDYLPGKEWQGKVDYIYPSLNAQNRTLRLRLRFKNKEVLLKPNMFAQVVIHPTVGDKSVIAVPREALIRLGDVQRVVLALGNGRFKSVNVKTGAYGKEKVEVLSGLKIGDRVVISAQFLLDSESSKTSDFKRIHSAQEVPIQSAAVSGKVNSININKGVVNISRGPIEKWNRPAATMDFDIEKDVNVEGLTAGVNIDFSFEIRGNNFVLVSWSKSQVSGAGHLQHDIEE